LPGRRTELYAKVIRRMLTGRWRGSGDRDPDPDACLETLRDWAWSAAVRDPVSGVGVWEDDFPTPRVRLSLDDRDALDHVAVPLGPPDADTGMTQRRFVHRSIREHLVAEHVAQRMTAEEAAEELLIHLWYDPDWENTAPFALVLHPGRSQVLKKLVQRLTGSAGLYADLSAVDSCREVRQFLMRVALESSEDDWSAEAAGLIGQARIDLVSSGSLDYVAQTAASWATSNGGICEVLPSLLHSKVNGYRAAEVARVLAAVDPTERARARARAVLIQLLDNPHFHWELDREDYIWSTLGLADGLTRLSPTEEDRQQARKKILWLLNRVTEGLQAAALASLGPTGQDPMSLRACREITRCLDLDPDS
jgi:hypothetical protein